MNRFGAEVSRLERHASIFTLEALEPLLPASLVTQVLAACGRASRRCRDLPAELVVWLTVSAGLWRSQGLRNVLASLGRGICRPLGWMSPGKAGRLPTSAAITRARGRLGLKPLRRLFREMVRRWRARPEGLPRWKGLPLVAIDGTVLRMPDTPPNRAHFGSHPVRHLRQTAFPFTRVAVAMCAFTHVVLASVVGKAHSHDIGLFPRLLRKLPAKSLLLLDRGFCSYAHLLDALRLGHAFVVRRRCGLTYKRGRRLGSRDYLVQITLHRLLRQRRPDLPPTFELRAVSYQRPGFRAVTLLTSLTDAQAFPAAEIIARYRDRWEVELGFDEIKTHMLDKHIPLRSKSPALVLQEIDGMLVAYNAVRMHMSHAGRAAGLEPRSLSFTDALERLRDIALLMARTAARRLPELFAAYLEELAACRLPPRRPRRYPRTVKAIPSYYPIRKRDRAA